MKKYLLGFFAVAALWAQPLFAHSSNEGGEKQKQKEVAKPASPTTDHPMQAEGRALLPSLSNSMRETTTTQGGQPLNSPLVLNHERETDNRPTPQKVASKHHFLAKLMKPTHIDRGHSDSATFGILAFFCGIVGMVLAWFAWPAGLLFAVLAIIFGIVGLSGGRSGNLFALAGLLLGIATILLPLLLYWWIAAF
jgi:hypothetical protein